MISTWPLAIGDYLRSQGMQSLTWERQPYILQVIFYLTGSCLLALFCALLFCFVCFVFFVCLVFFVCFVFFCPPAAGRGCGSCCPGSPPGLGHFSLPWSPLGTVRSRQSWSRPSCGQWWGWTPSDLLKPAPVVLQPLEYDRRRETKEVGRDR